MSVEVIDKIKPKNGGKFKIIDAVDVEMNDGTSLEETLSTISRDVNDITHGKFDPNNYLNKEQLESEYYDKSAIDSKLDVLNDKVDTERITNEIREELTDFFGDYFNNMENRFDLYVTTEDFDAKLKEILGNYSIDGSNLDIESIKEQLSEYFYSKDEIDKKDIEVLVNTVIEEKITSLSNQYCTKEELKSKLDVETFESHNDDMDDRLLKIDTSITTLDERITTNEEYITECIQDINNKADSRDIQSIQDSLESHIIATNELIGTYCKKEEVEGIVIDGLKDDKSKIKATLKDEVLENYCTIGETIEAVETITDSKLGDIYGILDVSGIDIGEVTSTFDNIKDSIDGLDTKIEDKVKSINTDIKGITGVIPKIKEDIANLQANTDSNSGELANINEKIDNIEVSLGENIELTDSINDKLPEIERILGEHKEFIDDFDMNLSYDAIKEFSGKLEEKIDEFGAQTELLLKLDSGDDIALGENVAIVDADNNYPEGSIYYKIFNLSKNMRYEDELAESGYSIFDAEKFLEEINLNRKNIESNDSDISRIETDLRSVLEDLPSLEFSIRQNRDNIIEFNDKVGQIDTFNTTISEFALVIEEIEERVNDIDILTDKSIVTKINNMADEIKINPESVNLKGAINYSCLGGDLLSLLKKNLDGDGILIDGKKIAPNTIDKKSLDLRGITVNSIENEEGKNITKFVSFSISDAGLINIKNPNILSSGYELKSDGSAKFKNIEAEGKFILPNAGLYGIKESDNDDSVVRIWAGSNEENKNKAPFRVQQDGLLFSSSSIIGGKVAATSLNSGTIHLEDDEIRINNIYSTISENGIENKVINEDIDYVVLSPRESSINTNVKFGSGMRYNTNFNKLELEGSFDIKDKINSIKVKPNEVVMKSNKSEHKVYQDNVNGTMVFESGNNSSLTTSDFKFASRDSVRDCSVKVEGSLEVTNEIKNDKNNVVMCSTKNGFAFFCY